MPSRAVFTVHRPSAMPALATRLRVAWMAGVMALGTAVIACGGAPEIEQSRTLGAPRLVFPPDRSFSATRMPIFRWRRLEGERAWLELCEDAACRTVDHSEEVTGRDRTRILVTSCLIHWRIRTRSAFSPTRVLRRACVGHEL